MAGDRNVKMVFEMDVKGVESLKKAVASIKEAERASKGLEGQTRATTSATREKMSFWDKVVNRIAQGIPTMFSLVAAYKALALAINVVTSAIKDMDDELVQQQKFGQMITLFNQFTGVSGKAVTSAENFAKSMNVAAAATEYFKQVSVGTSVVWEDMMKAANTFGQQALGKGIGVEEVLRLATAFGVAATSVEDLQNKAEQMMALLKRPSSRNELLVQIGFSKADIAEVNKGGTTIKEVFESVLKVQERLAESMKDKEKTFSAIFRTLKESALDAFQNGLGVGADGFKAKMEEMGPKIVEVAKLIGGEMRRMGEATIDILKMLSPLWVTLGMILLAAATAFDLVTAAIMAATSGLLMMGEAMAKDLSLLIAFGAKGLRALGFDTLADGVDDAAKAVVKFSQWAAKASKDAADGAVAAIDRAERRAKDAETFIARVTGPRITDKGSLAKVTNAMGGSTVTNQTKAPFDNSELEKNVKLLNEIAKGLERTAQASELQQRVSKLNQIYDDLERIGRLLRDPKDIATWNRAMENLGKSFEETYADAGDKAEKFKNTIQEIGLTAQKELSGKDLSPFEASLMEVDRKAITLVNTLEEVDKKIMDTLGKGAQSEALEADIKNVTESIKKLAEANKKYQTEMELARQKMLKGTGSGDYIRLQMKDAENAMRPLMDRVREITQVILEHSKSAADGIKLGVVAFLDSIDTEAKAAYEAVTGTLNALKQGFSDGLLAILTGNKADIENAMKNMMNSLARILTDYLTESIMAGIKNGLGDMDSFLSSLFGGKKDKDGKKIPIVDEQGNILVPGGADASESASDTWLAENGQKILAATGGAIALANAAKKGTLTPLSGAISGAAMGATFGWVGAIVGAVIGAIAGIFSQEQATKDRKRLDIFLSPSGQPLVRSAAPWGGNALTQEELESIRTAIAKKVDALQSEWIDMLLALPKKVFDTVLGMIPTMDSLKFNDLNGFGSEYEGGNTPDQYTKTIISGTENINKWLDIFIKQELPQAMFDAYKPILTKVFASLGFEDEKVKQLMNRWSTLGDGVTQEIIKIVNAVVTLEEVTKARIFEDDLAAAKTDIHASYTDQMKDGAFDNINKMNDLLNTGSLSMSNQVDLISRIASESQAMYENQLAYTRKIAEVQEAIHQSIQDQIFAMQLDSTGEDKNARKDMLFDQLQMLDGLLQQATSPDEIANIEARMQQLIGQIYQIDPEFYREWATESLNKLDEFAMERLKQLGEEATAYWNSQMEPILASLNLFKDVLDVISNGDFGEPRVPRDTDGDGDIDDDDNQGPPIWKQFDASTKQFGYHVDAFSYDLDQFGGWLGGQEPFDIGPDHPPPPLEAPPPPGPPPVMLDSIGVAFDTMTSSAQRVNTALDDVSERLGVFGEQLVAVGAAAMRPQSAVMPMRSSDTRGRTDTFDTGVR